MLTEGLFGVNFVPTQRRNCLSKGRRCEQRVLVWTSCSVQTFSFEDKRGMLNPVCWTWWLVDCGEWKLWVPLISFASCPMRHTLKPMENYVLPMHLKQAGNSRLGQQTATTIGPEGTEKTPCHLPRRVLAKQDSRGAALPSTQHDWQKSSALALFWMHSRSGESWLPNQQSLSVWDCKNDLISKLI